MIRTTFDKIKLSETTKFIVDNRGKTAPTEETGIALIATNCITNSSLYPSYDNVRYVSQETYDTWFRAHPAPGDVIVTNKGSQNGAICLVPDPVDFVIAQDMMALRANEEVIDPLYLFAALRSPMAQWQIKSLDVSGVIPHFKKSDFDKLFLPYPDMPTQKAIGKIYFDFCAKIELNRRMNATLESLARAIFKSWFVDFDPVKINAGKMPASSAIPTTHDPKVLDLFPSTFQDSELGSIPKGWGVKTLNDLGEVNRGRSRHRPRHADHLYGGPYPFVQTGDIKASAGRITSYEQTYSEDGLAQSRLWPEGTMCITIAANIAETAVLTFPACFPDSVIGFIPDESKCRVYIAEYIFRLLKERLQREATGSVQDNINLGTISRTYFVFPPIELQNSFYELFEPINTQIISNERESLTLAAHRDKLLPQLLSGELPVPEALTVAEEALV